MNFFVDDPLPTIQTIAGRFWEYVKRSDLSTEELLQFSQIEIK